MMKKLAFPIKREEWSLFAQMFLIVCLINVNFSILRAMRNALVVGDVGGSSAFIPYFELFGTFPMSILLTWGLSRLMRVFSLRFIFTVTMSFFLVFFIVFAFWIYPHRESIHTMLESKIGVFFDLSRFKVVITHWPDMVFCIMSELWKVALLSVIFWGFVNQNLSLPEAKRFYPPLMLGSSIGAVLAGPITVFCTSQLSWSLFALSTHRWQHSLFLLTLCLLICGAATLFLFRSMFKEFKRRGVSPVITQHKTSAPQKEPFSHKLLSLSSSLRYLLGSPYLCALLLIVIAEYVSYALGELIFLETLKGMYPTPTDYCQFMGNLTFWTGIITAFSALILTPYLLQTYRWTISALIPPIFMVFMTFAFFFTIYCGKIGLLAGAMYLPIAVIFGSLHFCISRAAKYTLFDASKELAFIPLDKEGQMKGKLIIDGIGSRLGRGTSSLLSISLFTLLGGPAESAIFTGIIAIVFALVSIPATYSIGHQFEKMTVVASQEKI